MMTDTFMMKTTIESLNWQLDIENYLCMFEECCIAYVRSE